MADAAKICWVVSDGRAGIENQALGLAEAIGRRRPLRIYRQQAHLPWPWRHLPSAATPSAMVSPDIAAGDPAPDLWIGCGRQAAAFTVAARRRQPRPFRVQLQDPRVDPRKFDLVVAPAHDALAGDNVLTMVGAPHRLTREVIAAAASALAGRASLGDGPRVAALIGGPNSLYGFGVADQAAIVDRLDAIAAAGARLLLTTSRRTPAAMRAALQARFGDEHLLDGAVDLYPGMLGVADNILVTADSVNMICEATAAGAPVQILSLTKRRQGQSKFDAFHAAMEAAGAVSAFDGALSRQAPAAFDETGRVADAVIARWDAATAD